MAKIDLLENETLFGDEAASHVKKILFLPQANPGRLYVTNMRVIFQPTQGEASSAFAYDIADISSFAVGMANAITLVISSGTSHKITGLFNKKLVGYLEAAGIKKS